MNRAIPPSNPRSVVRRALAASLVACVAVAGAVPGQAAERSDKREATIPLGSEPARRFNKTFQSWRRLQQRHVVMQAHEYSCGAAALATMFQYYFGDRITEAELLNDFLAGLDEKERKDREENGLSMNDLFEMAKRSGYQATVYPLGLAKLKELEAPVVVRLKKDDFKHFVVYRGAIEDRIYVADPLRGNVRIQAEEFAKQWNGVALVLGKSGFGLPKQHGLAVDEPKLFRPEIQPARRHLYRETLPPLR